MAAAVLILGTADWDQPIATNQHYAALQLAQAHSVTFVESTALRRPRLEARDVRRIIRRIAPGVVKPLRRRPTGPGIEVLRPRIIPFHVPSTESLNRWLMRRLVRRWLAERERLLWVYTPLVYGLSEYAPTIYHCVDLLAEVPGIDSRLVHRQEQSLAQAKVIARASSRAVKTHLEASGFKNVKLWPNVADVDIFRAKPGNSNRRAACVFAGNFTATKVDFSLLASLLENGLELHLAGPVSEGGGDDQKRVRDLVQLGAKYHGSLSLTDLSQLYSTCSLGLIPYVLNSYTLGVNPLKTYEYLAAGLAVLSTPVPAVHQQEPDINVASTDGAFVALAKLLIEHFSPDDVARRVTLSSEHSWSSRGEEMRALATQMTSVNRIRES